VIAFIRYPFNFGPLSCIGSAFGPDALAVPGYDGRHRIPFRFQDPDNAIPGVKVGL
jgi:hypothetical protein